ncbi:retrovirus-related pol polyprotein from transposon TNT 1-94 [Tanacetum coccineum]
MDIYIYENCGLLYDAITEGSWDFKHTKKVFLTEIIPWLNKFKDFFKEFDKGLLDEITELQTVFTQMEAAMEQCSNDVFIELSKRFSNLEQHYISLEVAKQLNKQIFQKDKSSDNQNHPKIQEYFEQNALKAQLQAKDIVISKLKETIHSLRENVNLAKVKKDIDEIETINIELEHSVAKLLSENEKLHIEKDHLKKTYKELYDSIKLKLKGKNVIDTAISRPYATTIAPRMFKLNIEPLALKVLKNKDAHLEYIKHSREHAYILREIVESARALSPLDSNLVYIRDTCHCQTRPSEKLVAVTPNNKDKKVRFADPVVQIVLWYLDSGCFKHMTRNRSQLTNFVNKFLGTVKFGNDQIAKIMGYGDYQIGNVTNSRVYYVEGLRHNLFSVGQLCDSDLEVAFCKHTCFVRNLKGVDLLMGSRGINLYTLSIGDIMKFSPICLLSKASKTNKKQSHKPKSEDTNQENLYLLHMDLYGPMHVESINEKKYILVIVDDYYRFTWVKFLRSKDEAREFIIKFMKMIQVHLNATIRNIHTNNGTKFVNQTLRSYYEDVGISHETSVARTLQQNGAEAVAIACYTQNRSRIRLRYGKTPYELLYDKTPNLSYLHVFGALCYPTNDSEDLGKLKAKADVGIFIGYAPAKKAYQIYNRRTRRIIETIHVDFDELTAMASEQSSSGPALHEMTLGTLIPEVAAPVQVVSTGTSSLMSVEQDAPSPSTLQTLQASPSHVIPPGAKEADHDIEVANMDNNP